MLNLLTNTLLAESEGNNNGWIMWLIIGVVLVLMIVLTIIPQKKRQKEQQKMMDSLTVGTKLMTVGGIVGKIVQVNTDNTLIVNVGTEVSPTLIVIDRKAVGYVLEAVPAATPEPVQTDETADEHPFEQETEQAEPTVTEEEPTTAPETEPKTEE